MMPLMCHKNTVRPAFLASWAVLLSLVLMAGPSSGEAKYTIGEDQLDSTKVYCGAAKGFDVAAEVDMNKVLKATPEYSEIKKKKIERGTGEYWILLNKASERALRAIFEVHDETGYDLVAAKGYLGSLNPPIPAQDITQLVVDKIENE